MSWAPSDCDSPLNSFTSTPPVKYVPSARTRSPGALGLVEAGEDVAHHLGVEWRVVDHEDAQVPVALQPRAQPPRSSDATWASSSASLARLTGQLERIVVVARDHVHAGGTPSATRPARSS